MNDSTEPRLLRDAVDLFTTRETPYGLKMDSDDWMSSERKRRVFLPPIDAFRTLITFLCISVDLFPGSIVFSAHATCSTRVLVQGYSCSRSFPINVNGQLPCLSSKHGQ